MTGPETPDAIVDEIQVWWRENGPAGEPPRGDALEGSRASAWVELVTAKFLLENEWRAGNLPELLERAGLTPWPGITGLAAFQPTTTAAWTWQLAEDPAPPRSHQPTAHLLTPRLLNRYLLGHLHETTRAHGDPRKGVIFTPPAIARYMARESLSAWAVDAFNRRFERQTGNHGDTRVETLPGLLEAGTPGQLREFLARDLDALHVWDPACGGGEFLVAVLAELVALRARLASRLAPREGRGDGDAGEWAVATVTKNLHGTDIFPSAARATRARLLLAVAALAARGSTPAATRAVVWRAAPALARNVEQCDFLLLAPGAASAAPLGQPALVLGNPPYRNIKGYYQQFKVYKALHPRVAAGKTDLYVFFLAQACKQLAPGGFACFITPNVFYRSPEGRAIRRFLRDEAVPRALVDFGTTQMFPGATTYTGITLFQKRPARATVVQYARVVSEVRRPEIDDVARLLAGDETFRRTLPVSSLTGRWSVEPYPIRDKVRSGAARLGTWFEPRAGIVTSRDAVFIGRCPEREAGTNRGQESEPGWPDPRTSVRFVPGREATAGRDPAVCREGVEVEVEGNILHPVLYGEDVRRYAEPVAKHWVLFPHDPASFEAYPPRRLARAYPRAWAYLRSRRETLGRRVRDARQHVHYADLPQYYMLHRPRAPRVFARDTLVTPALVRRSEFTRNARGHFFVGGTAGVYALVPREASPGEDPGGPRDPPPSSEFLLGCLNSRLFSYYFKLLGRAKRGGYYQINGTILKETPVRGPPWDERAGPLVAGIELRVSRCMAAGGDPAVEAEIDELVEDLYEITAEERAYIRHVLSGPG